MNRDPRVLESLKRQREELGERIKLLPKGEHRYTQERILKQYDDQIQRVEAGQ